MSLHPALAAELARRGRVWGQDNTALLVAEFDHTHGSPAWKWFGHYLVKPPARVSPDVVYHIHLSNRREPL